MDRATFPKYYWILIWIFYNYFLFQKIVLGQTSEEFSPCSSIKIGLNLDQSVCWNERKGADHRCDHESDFQQHRNCLDNYFLNSKWENMNLENEKEHQKKSSSEKTIWIIGGNNNYFLHWKVDLCFVYTHKVNVIILHECDRKCFISKSSKFIFKNKSTKLLKINTYVHNKCIIQTFYTHLKIF